MDIGRYLTEDPEHRYVVLPTGHLAMTHAPTRKLRRWELIDVVDHMHVYHVELDGSIVNDPRQREVYGDKLGPDPEWTIEDVRPATHDEWEKHSGWSGTG